MTTTTGTVSSCCENFMETENHDQEGERVEPVEAVPGQALTTTTIPPGELSPLNIIRTETVISRLPIHNLAKKGRVNIQIIQRTQKGEIDLKWEVSYSDRFGQPRQVAYKLDTIVINRKIEEGGRPLPEFIRLGSLRDIAKDLGLGTNAMLVKKALFQNASAFIDAKFKYKSNDGIERSLQAGFTRYSVIFTGEKLPDGRKADAVYIRLNPEYRDVLNSAPVRPLDYDYLKELPPVAQRFYEIVSRKIFAALKYDHPRAKLPYSEFCTFSAQQRQFDYDHFKKQMYKVHRPHLKSGYISKVEYELSTDGEGKTDWLMLYTPGEKARLEFQTFNGLPLITRRTRQKRIAAHQTQTDRVTDVTTPVQNLHPVLPLQPEKVEVDQKLLDELTAAGIFESEAIKLLAGSSGLQIERVGDYIDYWKKIPGEKTAGLLHSLIKKGDPLPSSFETRRQRSEREAGELRRQNLIRVKHLLNERYEEYCHVEVDRLIAEQISAEEFERRVTDHKAREAQQPGLWNLKMRPDLADTLARHAVRKEFADKLNFLPIEQFRKTELPKILAELGMTATDLGIELPADQPSEPPAEPLHSNSPSETA